MKMVTLEMVDGSTWVVSRTQARKYCSTPEIARKIADIVTKDKDFREQMRDLINNG